MGRAARARRVAVAAAYGGGGLGIMGAGAYGLLRAESKLARRAIPPADALPPDATGRYGSAHAPAPALRLVVLGDSSAAGFGVDRPEQTPGALIGSGLAEAASRPVDVRVLAAVGAQSSDLDAQVDRALFPGAPPIDVVLIMIGANDVTHRVNPGTSVRLLGDAVRRLHDTGAQVVVGTCPDLGTIEPIAQPLRWVARRLSRQLAAAQTIAVVEAGGRSVSLGDILGPEFAARPREMFAVDRFHPSAHGYRAAALTLLPTVCAALDLLPELAPDASRGERTDDIAAAAAEAAETAGTEVTGATGTRRGAAGVWAQVRRRSRQPLADPSPAEPAEGEAPAEAPTDVPAEGGG